MDHRDIVEIQQLMALYGHAVDCDQSLLKKVFTEDALFDGRPCGSPQAYQGLKAIEDWFALRQPVHPFAHLTTNSWVREEDGETRVKSKWIVKRIADGLVCVGDYDDVVVRTAEGWRIRHRVVMVRDPGTMVP